MVDRLTVDEELVVQHGPSSVRPAGARCIDFVPFEELNGLVARARVVVSHAGVGSILLCLSHGDVPIVLPRLSRFGEVVDDHQLVLARRLGALGAVTCAEDPADVPALVDASRNGGSAPLVGDGDWPLAADLNRFLDSVLN